MVRNPGDVVDPDLLWWQSRGARSVQREPGPEEVVRRRIREEDEHTSVATCICWIGIIVIPGRFFRGFLIT